MALDTITLLCSRTDVERILSIVGVDLHLDDDGDGEVSDTEDDALDAAIIDGSETVYFYTWPRYSPAALAKSNWVNRRAAILAAYAVCERKCNPVPDSMATRADKVEDELSLVLSGKAIPGVPQRRTNAPTWSNTRCTPGREFRVIRVERRTSSKQRTGRPQITDLREQATIEP